MADQDWSLESFLTNVIRGAVEWGKRIHLQNPKQSSSHCDHCHGHGSLRRSHSHSPEHSSKGKRRDGHSAASREQSKYRDFLNQRSPSKSHAVSGYRSRSPEHFSREMPRRISRDRSPNDSRKQSDRHGCFDQRSFHSCEASLKRSQNRSQTYESRSRESHAQHRRHCSSNDTRKRSQKRSRSPESRSRERHRRGNKDHGSNHSHKPLQNHDESYYKRRDERKSPEHLSRKRRRQQDQIDHGTHSYEQRSSSSNDVAHHPNLDYQASLGQSSRDHISNKRQLKEPSLCGLSKVNMPRRAFTTNDAKKSNFLFSGGTSDIGRSATVAEQYHTQKLLHLVADNHFSHTETSSRFESPATHMQAKNQHDRQPGIRQDVKADHSTEEESSRNARQRRCLISRCIFMDTRLKPHFFRAHLPQVLTLSGNCAQQVEALEYLARQLDFASLQLMLNAALKSMDADELIFSPALVISMKKLCKPLGIDPKRFTLPKHWLTYRSPALLLHWRVLATLINRLSSGQQNTFAKWEPPASLTSPEPKGSTFPANPSTVKVKEVSGGHHPEVPTGHKNAIHASAGPSKNYPVANYGAITESTSRLVLSKVPCSAEAGIQAMEIFDSHFHFDLMFGRNAQVSTMMKMPLSPVLGTPCRLKGGVMVFDDPQNYPRNIENTLDMPGFVAAIGLHPIHVASLTLKHKNAFKVFIQNPKVKALGDVGLDYRAKDIKKQETILEYTLKGFADPSKPIILHLRGSKGHEDEIYFRALKLVSKCVPPEQPIQIHCFSGGPTVFRHWQQHFTNVYASFSGMVRSFSESQKRGLQEVPASRLLLETDAPFLSTPTSSNDNTPDLIGDVANLVSAIRQEPVVEIVAMANYNLCRLFNIWTI